ncbi:hypothetical protein C8T65DRAFT_748775 [Cerioporus squamosus]|nr:hypothetical protein C8T65DRAFT_748775 [Cerioporus squamosus]
MDYAPAECPCETADGSNRITVYHISIFHFIVPRIRASNNFPFSLSLPVLMPALTLPSLLDATSWGQPVPPVPWELPVHGARGHGFIRIVDSLDLSRVNRLERLTIELHVHCGDSTGSEFPANDGMISLPFPARRQECRPWKDTSCPLDIDLAQLQQTHEESFVALHLIFAYFGAFHPPGDEDVVQMQWHRFARGVWAVMEAAEIAQDERAVAVASWGKANLPDEVFDGPWWAGRWNWYPPLPRQIEYTDEEDVSEFEFGEGLDGLPVPEGTFPPQFWAGWAADAVGPVTRGRSLGT